MALKIIAGNDKRMIKTLGNTTQTKELVNALMEINSSDSDLESKGWKKVKEAFEKFGFRTAYDRNMVIITGALFAAISNSKCESLNTLATAILKSHKPGTVKDCKGKDTNLAEAIEVGDGKCIHSILIHQNRFDLILTMINLNEKSKTAYINRTKKITPWRIGNSTKAASAVGELLNHMLGETADGKDVPNQEEYTDVKILDSFVIKSKKDFKKAREMKETLRSVDISNKITTIPMIAFSGFSQLENVDIANSVVEIQNSAFENCTKLKSIKLSNKLREIKANAFENCTGLKSITIPENVEDVQGDAFLNCENLKKVEFLGKPPTISENAFRGCHPKVKFVYSNE